MSDEELAESIRSEFMSASRSPANSPSDANPIIGWAIRGFVGAATIVLRLIASGIPLSDPWKETLLQAAEEIIRGIRDGD